MDNGTRQTVTAEKIAFTLTADQKGLCLELQDRVTGRTWGPAPLLAMDIHDKRLRRVERMTSFRVEAVEKVQDGLHVVVTQPTFSVEVGLWLRVRDGELSVMLSPPEVYERQPELFRLFALDVLPGLATVGGDGQLLLPINAAVLCSPANKPAASDRFLIYLEQPRWELATMVPACSAWDPEGGLMFLATQTACEAECHVATDGRGNGTTRLSFSLRRYWPDPVDYGNREIRIVPIPPGEDGVHFTARRLRKHVVEDLGKATLKQRAEECPQIAYQLSCMALKLFHGMENEGACMGNSPAEIQQRNTSFQNTMTFAETKSCLKKLRDAGIPRLYTQSVGWNCRGHDGLYPTRFPIDERLGGEAGFRDMLAFGHDLGYVMNVHDNFQMNVPTAPDWDADCVIQDMFGQPLVRGWWAAGIEYGVWPGSLPFERVTGHMQRVKDLGVRGTYYMDYMLAPLEVNYHPKHGGPRGEHLAGQIRLMEEAKRIFGSVSTEIGTLPAGIVCEVIASGGPHGWWRGAKRNYPEWPVSSLMDSHVPLYELAMHGLTTGASGGGPTWRRVMHSIVYGQCLRDEWGVRAIQMGGIAVFSDQRVAALKAAHDLCVEQFGRLVTEELTQWSSPADQVVQTRYADGTEVTADFGEGQLQVNGKRIEKPKAVLGE